MKKLFVDYKTALLLHQLGFNEKCLGYYRQNGYHRITIKKAGIQFSLDYKWGVVAPIHTQVQEWLVRIYNIEVTMYKQFDFEGYACWCTWGDVEDKEEAHFLKTKQCKDYFDALNQGILETLQYIIKNNIKPIINES